MKPTMTVDTREFVKAARELFATSNRTCVDFTNGQSLKVASLALKLTESASAAEIERELGAIARNISVTRSGKVRRGGYVLGSQDTVAHRIIGARMKLTGDPGVKGSTRDEMASNLIKMRIRAANFIRSGWIPVINYFSSIVRVKPPKASTSKFGAKQFGRPKGKGYRATFSVFGKIESKIENSALNAKVIPPSKRGNPMKIAERGLSKALAESARDMIETLRKRLQPDFKKVSAK